MFLLLSFSVLSLLLLLQLFLLLAISQTHWHSSTLTTHTHTMHTQYTHNTHTHPIYAHNIRRCIYVIILVNMLMFSEPYINNYMPTIVNDQYRSVQLTDVNISKAISMKLIQAKVSQNKLSK